MAIKLGADVAEMDKIWGCQTFLEQSFEKWEDQVCLFQVFPLTVILVLSLSIIITHFLNWY